MLRRRTGSVDKAKTGTRAQENLQVRTGLRSRKNVLGTVLLAALVPLVLSSCMNTEQADVSSVDPAEAAQRTAPEWTGSEAQGVYDIGLTLRKDGSFVVTTSIEVTNRSKDSWRDIGFYLVPNALNTEATPDYEAGSDAEVNISSLKVGGKPSNYTLTNNALTVDLPQLLKPGQTAEISVNYGLSLPENGPRLSRVGNNYYLAHWYPMLAPYEEGWVLRDYDGVGESYETGYGAYTVRYRMPQAYLVAGSAEDGKIRAVSSGVVTGTDIKDFYLALLDPEEWEFDTRTAGSTQLRVFTPKGAELLEETADMAADTYAYFSTNIGDNPSPEVDLIANDGYMEYPNVVEVAADAEAQRPVLVHELAHQWFYYRVSSDPYDEAWLDESITEFAASLLNTERLGSEEAGFADARIASTAYPTKTYANLPMDQFDDDTYYSTVYGKIPLLLNDFFADHGGREGAIAFLSAYYAEFKMKQVNTEEFKAFFEDYFEGDQSEYLNSCLR